MKDIMTSLQILISSLGGCLGWFLGGTDGFLYAIIIFIILDYITGVMVAILQHKLSSEVGFRGIFKKVVILCLVGMGHILDTKVVRSGNVMRTAIIFFYLSNEGISILENVAMIGLPIPKKLLDILIALKSENSEDIDNLKKLEDTLKSGNQENMKNAKELIDTMRKEDVIKELKQEVNNELKEAKELLEKTHEEKTEEENIEIEKKKELNKEEDQKENKN